MKIYSVQVTDQQIERIEKELSILEVFSFGDVKCLFMRLGLEPAIADRAADRYLQKLKRDGFAVYKGRLWHLV